MVEKTTSRDAANDPVAPAHPSADLSKREREVLDLVASANGATAEEVRAAMADPPTNAAVRTTLRGLVEKGRLTRRYDGPRFVYQLAQPRKKAGLAEMRHLIDTFFGGSTRAALVGLLEMDSAELEEETRDELRQMVERAAEEGL